MERHIGPRGCGSHNIMHWIKFKATHHIHILHWVCIQWELLYINRLKQWNLFLNSPEQHSLELTIHPLLYFSPSTIPFTSRYSTFLSSFCNIAPWTLPSYRSIPRTGCADAHLLMVTGSGSDPLGPGNCHLMQPRKRCSTGETLTDRRDIKKKEK